MRKTKYERDWEKLRAADAAASAAAFVAAGRPTPDDEALRREAGRIQAAKEERLALRAERAATFAASAEAQPIASALPEVLAAIGSLRAAVSAQAVDTAGERAWTLKHRIFPRLESWGFEKRFRREILQWGCAEQQATFTVSRKKLAGVGAVVALIGRRGTGKTTIAAQLALARAWDEHARREAGEAGAFVAVSYRKVAGIVRRMKPLYAAFGSLDTESLERSLRHLCETDLLIIDEMHDLSELAAREAILIDVIDRRYAALRDTLLISNQTPEEWDAQTPVSIQSRIQEHGAILSCEWDSWREKEGA